MNNLSFTLTTNGNKGNYNYQITENGLSARNERITNGKSGTFSDMITIQIKMNNGVSSVTILS